MSAGIEPHTSEDPRAPGATAPDAEEIDALPVLAEEATVLRAGSFAGAVGDRRSPMMPAVQAAAVAAGGFVAGAAVVGLVHRRRHASALSKGRAGRDLARGGRRGRAARAGELVQIVGSRSLLVDVHLLGGSGAD